MSPDVIIPGFFSLLSALAVAVLGYRQHVATQRQEIKAGEREAAMLLIEQYQEEVKDIRARFGSDVQTLTGRLAETNARLVYLEGGIRALSSQIRELNHDPVFVPNGHHYGNNWSK